MLAKTLLFGAFAALAAAQSAVLTFTRVPNPITDGQPQAILYATNDTQTPVTILLRRGSANNLQTVQTLTTEATGGQYIWTPPLSLENGNDYALEIRQAGQNNYFGPFTVQGASPAAVASASASSASASASATSGGSSSVTGSMTTMGGANMTTTGNGTMTMTDMSSSTGMSMPHNTTMTSPTLSSSSGDMSSTMTDAGTTTGADFQGTSSSASPSSTDNAAASDLTGGKSTLAFVLGALAAVVYVH